MVRNFEDRPIPDEIVQRIIGNALHAPSAGFSQGWAFLVLQGKDKERFHEVTFPDRENFRFDGTFKAPLLIVCLSHKDAYLDRYAEDDKGWTDRDEARWPAPYWDIDTGFAALLMLLTVVDAGLGAVFFGITPDKIPPSVWRPRRLQPDRRDRDRVSSARRGVAVLETRAARRRRRSSLRTVAE
jgi:nitroreductase